MEAYTVKVFEIFHVTHDVKGFRLLKPEYYSFDPGQATELAINKPGWREEKRPFTFTNLPVDDYLELMIKTYPSHEGVTNELLKVKKDDELILHEVFGAITYKGKGVFIAGGAGITPFISILRDLQKSGRIADHTLLFANKTKADIILEDEFRNLLGKSFINILSDEETEGYFHGMISHEFLSEQIKDFNQRFYLCGPPPMIDSLLKLLADFGVGEKSIIKEEF
jgi:ferredoxin-NADP reductase